MTDATATLSIAAAAAALRRRDLSPVDLVEHALERASKLQPSLNCFITVLEREARDAARHAEAEIVRGDLRSVLHGLPYTVKDLFATAGVRTTAGSRVLAEWVSDEDAAVVARLRAAGAVLIGKTNTSEFAAGPTNANEHYGAARNPWNPAHVPGGSSGGSAAAVAAGAGFFSLGTDTGGSIRIPASACGVVGWKPTFGRLSRRGVVMLAWSLDTVGVLGRAVDDVAHVLDVLAPEDDGGRPVVLRVGLPVELLAEPCDEEVRQLFDTAMDRFAAAGGRILRVSMPWSQHALPANNLISWFESRVIHEPTFTAQASTYGRAISRRVLMGAAIRAEEYAAAQRVRHRFTRLTERVFHEVDVLALPTLSVSPPPVGVDEVDVAGRRVPVLDALGRFTRFASFTGQPAVSLPCGLTATGLPVGLQLVGPLGSDRRLLAIARACEAASGWAGRSPQAA
jgi:aspartyl-tRNA(Asn)/glutamyl-tRNA(Gln) amidotransferase subunit A